MYSEHVSGIGVLSSHGEELVGNISVSDLRCLAPGLFWALLLPVKDFLAKRPLLTQVQLDTAQVWTLLNAVHGQSTCYHACHELSVDNASAAMFHLLVVAVQSDKLNGHMVTSTHQTGDCDFHVRCLFQRTMLADLM